MEATKENFQIVKEIIEILAKHNCTVKQAEKILLYIARTEISNGAAVQMPDSSRFNKLMSECPDRNSVFPE